jgi:hypothetical protein
MTERQEVRFNVYNNTNNSYGAGSILAFNIIDFNVGGFYDFNTYKYTFSVSGTFLIGISYNKLNSGDDGRLRFQLTRGGNTETIAYIASKGGLRSTINNCFVYQFEVGDIIFGQVDFGAPRMNLVAVPAGNIYNSFWGIRLDY